MKRSEREAATRGSTHLLRLSLPAVRSNGSFEGADILAESAAVPAVLLCQVYRGVMAWALTSAAEHPGLFPAGAGEEGRRLLEASPVPAELRPALETACELLDDPVGADPKRVAEACARIGDWAERRGDAPATALRFMQAAATCSPNDARIAYRAGRIARQRANWDLAELWFRHSSTVGRRTHDWQAHATAYLGLGNAYYRQGRYTPARREHLKALRVAKRHGLREIQGMAFHDLFAVAIELRDYGRADEYGQAAFEAYGTRHPAIPALAHDIAYFWNTRGMYRQALPVFSALLPHFRDSAHYLSVLASLGRAAGGAADKGTFMSAWVAAWDLAPAMEGSAILVTSMLELAYGAAEVQEWHLADTAVRRAIDLARRRGETDVVVRGGQLLESIARSGPVPLDPDVESTVAPRPLERRDRFVGELVASLQESARPLSLAG